MEKTKRSSWNYHQIVNKYMYLQDIFKSNGLSVESTNENVNFVGSDMLKTGEHLQMLLAKKDFNSILILREVLNIISSKNESNKIDNELFKLDLSVSFDLIGDIQ